jgi:hypothetical protein
MYAIETITDRITLVMLDIRIWSGRKKLRPEDLHLSGGEIPPEDLVSLGSKRVCDPEPLKVFSRIKQSAERACLRVGTRFLGGFAVPHEHAEELADRLAVLKDQFDVKSAEFLRDYDRALEQWIASLPEWEEPIRRAIEPANVVGGRLHFGFQLIAVSPAEHAGTLEEDVQGLGNGIFAEVGQMACQLEGSFEGKDKLHRRALSTFGRIREKLACLSFIDRRIQPVVDAIDDWTSRLPKTGPIAAGIFNEGMGLALLLADPDRMARHGAGQMAVRNGTATVEADPEEPPTAPFPEDFEFETDEFQATPQEPVHPSVPAVDTFYF